MLVFRIPLLLAGLLFIVPLGAAGDVFVVEDSMTVGPTNAGDCGRMYVLLAGPPPGNEAPGCYFLPFTLEEETTLRPSVEARSYFTPWQDLTGGCGGDPIGPWDAERWALHWQVVSNQGARFPCEDDPVTRVDGCVLPPGDHAIVLSASWNAESPTLSQQSNPQVAFRLIVEVL